MNRTRVKAQNGPNLGAKRNRTGGPVSIGNDEWGRSGPSPFGPVLPNAQAGVAPLAQAASLDVEPRLLLHVGRRRRGCDSYVSRP